MGHPSVTLSVTQVFREDQLVTALGDRYDRNFWHVTLYARTRIRAYAHTRIRAGVSVIRNVSRIGHHGHPTP
jgi:hypothetical protein